METNEGMNPQPSYIHSLLDDERNLILVKIKNWCCKHLIISAQSTPYFIWVCLDDQLKYFTTNCVDLLDGVLVQWLLEEIYFLKVMSLNPSTIYLMDILCIKLM